MISTGIANWKRNLKSNQNKPTNTKDTTDVDGLHHRTTHERLRQRTTGFEINSNPLITAQFHLAKASELDCYNLQLRHDGRQRFLGLRKLVKDFLQT